MNIEDLNRRVARGLSRRLMEGAVSYKTPKVLLKEYGPAFSKMTLGFECEIAMEKTIIAPEKLEQLRAGWAIDYDVTNQIDNFSFTLITFLRRLAERESIGTIISRYSVKPRYGFAGQKYRDNFLDFFGRHTAFLNFKVIDYEGDGKLYAPAFGATGTQEKNEFVYRKPRIDFDTLFSLAEPFISDYAQLIDDNSLTGEEFTETLDEFTKSIVELRKNMHLTRSHAEVFSLWRDIDEFRMMFGTMTENMLSDSNASKSWSVLDEEGSIKNIDVTRSMSLNRTNLNFGLIECDRVKLESDYNDAILEAKEKNLRDYIARRENNYLSERSTNSTNSAVDLIHGLVLDTVDDDAKLSYNYHDERTQKFKGTNTVVEPDRSIEPNGAEVVSPVFKEHKLAFKWLDDIFDMIDANGLSTNKTTGLHVNIGTFAPIDYRYDRSSNNKDSKGHSYIDVVKLAIISGDSFLLKQFNREANTYAVSLEEDLETLMTDFERYGFSNEFIQQSESFTDLRMQLNDTFLQRSGTDAKYRTINTIPLKNGYLEFRIAGGANYHKDKEKIKRAVLRYMQLCAAASDPKLYAKEYLRALYKIFVVPKIQPSILIAKNPTQAVQFLELWTRELAYKTNDTSIYDVTQWSKARTKVSYKTFDRDNLVNLFLEFGKETWEQANFYVYAAIRILLKSATGMNNTALKQFYNENKEQQRHEWHNLTYMPNNVIDYIYTGTGLNLKGKP